MKGGVDQSVWRETENFPLFDNSFNIWQIRSCCAVKRGSCRIFVPTSSGVKMMHVISLFLQSRIKLPSHCHPERTDIEWPKEMIFWAGAHQLSTWDSNSNLAWRFAVRGVLPIPWGFPFPWLGREMWKGVLIRVFEGRQKIFRYLIILLIFDKSDLAALWKGGRAESLYICQISLLSSYF